jgi:hypothetical protein
MRTSGVPRNIQQVAIPIQKKIPEILAPAKLSRINSLDAACYIYNT